MKRYIGILMLVATTAIFSESVVAQDSGEELEQQSFFRGNTNNRPIENPGDRGRFDGAPPITREDWSPGNPDDDDDNPVIDAIPVNNGLLALLLAGGLLGVWRLYPSRKKAPVQ